MEAEGLGFCDLRLFNISLLGKQGWNLLTKSHTLVARVFKEKYFPSGDYLSSILGLNLVLFRRVFGQQRRL